MRSKLLSLGFAGLLVFAAVTARPARAGQITLDVSGTLTGQFNGASCSPTCQISGDVVIDNSAGASNQGIVSEDVTTSGFSPSIGPFTTSVGVFAKSFFDANTEISIEDSAGDQLFLDVETMTAGSLVGYDGGSLSTISSASGHLPEPIPGWDLSSGSLTAVPEPASLTLLGSALLGFGVIRRRRKNV